MANDILIVDDEADIRDLVAGILDDEGFKSRTARDSDTAFAEISARRPNLIFLDIWIQGSRLDGLQMLEQIKREHPDVPVVMISGHGNIETAVAAIKRGAYDFIEKPFKADRLILVATRALETSRLKREVRELKQHAPSSGTLVGRSPSMNQLRQTIDRAAKANSRIMIVGPSGGGKELAARTLHAMSSRAQGPFVVINAAAITPERMEVELFGVELTDGETGRKPGALEEAHGGTLFIDEIADMPRETQNRILRVLVDQTFQRVGGTTKVNVDVRIISSTARNLESEIAEGRFREDLYHRLSVVPIRVPPLSERREDIPDLVDYFMEQISTATGLPKRRIGEDAMAVLQSHVWPGNIRQLRNNVERVMILAGGDTDAVISADMLPQDVGSMIPAMPTGNNGEHIMGLPLREAREVFERDYLIAQISRFSGNISRTAEFVGMERSALHRKLKALGVVNRMSRVAYVNGQYRDMRDASVNIEDRGYQFADGVYEVCEVRNGQIIDFPKHMKRLQRSLSELRIAMPMPLTALQIVVHEVIRRNRVGYGIVYLQVTRGVARRDHAFPTKYVKPAVVVTARNLSFTKSQETAARGIGVITVPENRWPRVDIKSVSLLPNVLAKQQARENGAYEAWFVDTEGLVTEGSSSNAWIVTKDGRVVTRSAEQGILAGITRSVLTDVMAALQIKFEERPFTPEEAYEAAEAFVTASSQIVMPVVRIDGRNIGDGTPGLISKRLREEFHRFSSFS